MLKKEVKDEIQKAYSQFLEAKTLKPRLGQKLMIAEIARTLGSINLDGEGVRQSEGHLCVVEAGTGTGKTVSYLLAALPIAKALGKKVVLSTATIALQEQIVLKDLPDVIRYSGLQTQFRLAKGRGRYMCLTKLDRILSDVDDTQLIPLYEDEFSVIDEKDAQLYNDMMQKLSVGEWDGDRDSWDDEIDQSAWARVTTDHRQCTGRNCSHVRSCSFFKAREALDTAECIVANHDLVLADLALGGGAILPAPEDTIYIFDEGHHLSDKALNHFSVHARYKGTIRWLGQSEGQWPSLAETACDASYFTQLAKPLEGQLKHTRSIMEENLHVIQFVVTEAEARQESRHQSNHIRFEQGVVPEGVEQLAKKLSDSFAELASILEKLSRELSTLLEQDYSAVPRVDLESLYAVVGSWHARAEGSLDLWRSYSNSKVDEKWPIARWITVSEFNDIVDFEIVSSPILASKALESGLWSRCCGAVITSATLTALNSFDRFKYRSGTYDDAQYAVVPSPFNFTENALLSVPHKAVEANDALLHTDSIIDILPELLDQNAGSLVLFSSRRQMQDVYDGLDKKLRDMVLLQGVESKQALVRNHKATLDKGNGSIIFGLASFAEGVDLPGHYCSHVVIAKLPFSVPDAPLEAALAEWIESKGGNAFMQISVPDASVRLIQACGRLLRTETDTGKVSILDRRIISKRYGKALLEALPPFSRDF